MYNVVELSRHHQYKQEQESKICKSPSNEVHRKQLKQAGAGVP